MCAHEKKLKQNPWKYLWRFRLNIILRIIFHYFRPRETIRVLYKRIRFRVIWAVIPTQPHVLRRKIDVDVNFENEITSGTYCARPSILEESLASLLRVQNTLFSAIGFIWKFFDFFIIPYYSSKISSDFISFTKFIFGKTICYFTLQRFLCAINPLLAVLKCEKYIYVWDKS